MTPNDVAASCELLRADFPRAVVFGSFGLVLHGVYDAARVKDVDVIASVDDAIAIARSLLARGFSVRSWQDALTPNQLTRARLVGRIYLRATREPRVIDVTYEGFDVDVWRRDAVVIEGVNVASVARIERQRLKRATTASGT